MSDIPVGSPPAPPGRHAAPGGWYLDPVDARQERYWDGWQWSRTTRPRESAQPTLQRPYGAEPQNPYATPPNAGAAPLSPGSSRNQAATTADGVPLAGWWWRVLATLVDNLITSAVVAVLGFSVYRSFVEKLMVFIDTAMQAARSGAAPPSTPSTRDLISTGDQALLVALTLVVGAVYQLSFLRLKSATPGKLLCGLRVVPVDAGRAPGPLAWNVVGIRTALWVLPGVNSLLGIFQLVDVLFPLFHPRRQALHDLAAKTQVVRRR